MSSPDPLGGGRSALCRALVELAEAAGREILRHYAGPLDVRAKADASPVTAADEAAEALIVDGLRRLLPDLPIVAEELCAAGRAPQVGERFALVDPLDGTREFVSRNGEFTVNIALVERGVPHVGVVHLPAAGASYWTDGVAAFRRLGRGAAEEIACRRTGDGDPLVVVASRSHRDHDTDAFIAGLRVAEIVSAGSSLKFCRVAEGAADVYPRFGRTMEWDTAAGDAVVRAAGGSVTTLEGEPFHYGKPGFANPGFVVRGARA